MTRNENSDFYLSVFQQILLFLFMFSVCYEFSVERERFLCMSMGQWSNGAMEHVYIDRQRDDYIYKDNKMRYENKVEKKYITALAVKQIMYV